MTDMTLDEQIEEYLRFCSGVPPKERAIRLRHRTLRDFTRYCGPMRIKTAADMTSTEMVKYANEFLKSGGELALRHRLDVLIDFFVFAQKNGWTDVNWTKCMSGGQGK